MTETITLDHRVGNRWNLAAGVAALSATGLGLAAPVHLRDPALRATLETVIMICAGLTGCLIYDRWRATGRSRDALLLGALATVVLVDLMGSLLPALNGLAAGEPQIGVLGGQLLVALAFAVASLVPYGDRLSGGPRPWLLALLAGADLVVIADVVALAAQSHSRPGALSTTPAVAAVAGVVCAIALVGAAIGFRRRREHADDEPRLLAAGVLLLAASRLQYLAIPAAAADWVTPSVALRVAAYGVLLLAAVRHRRRLAQASAEAALRAERERIARDLHDGLAQDLAFIAAHSERLADEYGSEHPLTIAARHALAASRGAVADLACSQAPSTVSALEHVATELESRFGVEIDVKTSGATGADGELGLDRRDREEVVRIAREAIVNAITHGQATHVDVELGTRGSGLVVRISDDGCGLGGQSEQCRVGGGFGLRMMRARAASLGARLVARPLQSGGTEVLVLPDRELR